MEVERGLALRVDHLAADEPVLEQLLLRGTTVFMMLFVVSRAMRISVAELIDQLEMPRPLRSQLLEPCERGLGRETSSVHLIV